ncbi:hypothetical protein Q7C36_013145 [Tachysurus vachellii]|uniref:Uncharacterized protein n=1 Tax=Tachysurus vachellii TaxID=175792 RepID=A0AA88MKR6_TACVA|nr:hypothetical protein Q7C36_013145 [Tachysurus vachellii]
MDRWEKEKRSINSQGWEEEEDVENKKERKTSRIDYEEEERQKQDREEKKDGISRKRRRRESADVRLSCRRGLLHQPTFITSDNVSIPAGQLANERLSVVPLDLNTKL